MMREEIGKLVLITSTNEKGIIVDAIPDFDNGRGLLCKIAIGCGTFDEAKSVSPPDLVSHNTQHLTFLD